MPSPCRPPLVDGVLYNGVDPLAAHRAAMRLHTAALRAQEQQEALAFCASIHERHDLLYPFSGRE